MIIDTVFGPMNAEVIDSPNAIFWSATNVVANSPK